MVKQFDLNHWFEKLALRILSYDLYLSLDNKELAYLILYKYEKSPERSWGWKWGSWLTWLFDGDEYYQNLSYEEKKKLDQALYEYIQELADRVSNERKIELEKMI